MSRTMTLFPRLQWSVYKEVRKLFTASHFHSKLHVFLQPTPRKQICNSCFQHHRFLSSNQKYSQQTNLETSAAAAAVSSHQSSSCTETESGILGSRGCQQPDAWNEHYQRPEPQLNWEYLCDPENRDFICDNIVKRKGVGDIDKVCHLWKTYQDARSPEEKQKVWQELLLAGLDIPNTSHPDSPVGEESNSRTVEVHSERREFDFKPKTVVELGERLQMLRTDNVAMTTGPRTYYFLGDLARLEQALVRFTLSRLKEKGFQLVSVPDLLHPDIIESCGFKTQGERTQVYRLKDVHGPVCLAGTAEMSLGGLFVNEVLDVKDLPKKVTAVSRCFRAETSDIAEERGIYRVHQFTKVEMFGVTSAERASESGQLLQDLVDIERELFISLGLHFRVLDMPTEELGAPAHRKFDIETWMPGKGFWGEISSASDCTDFQARRLNIRYKDEKGNIKFAHTVNGTACAVPRMVMALLENNQQQDGSVILPQVLQPWLESLTLSPPSGKDPFVRIHDRRKR